MKFSKTSVIVLAVLSLITLGSILVMHLAGFRFFTIVSPSMGETAPVGTLVVTQPQQQYREQDIISFYRSGNIYTHRLTRVSNESYITKGDLNAAEDSRPVKQADVIGKAVVVAPIWGWVWQALPILIIGWVIVYLVSCIRRLREGWRWPVRIVGGTLVLILATLIVNPWLRVDMLSIATHQHGEVRLHVVNTGIFPIRDDDGNRIYSGQTAIVRATDTDAQGRYVYIPRPSLGALGVLFALLWCLLPLFVALIVKLPPPEEELTGLQLKRERRRNMSLLVFITLFEIVLLLIQLSSLAAFTAEVKNTDNTISSRTYFKCAHAVWDRIRPQASPRPYFAWGMNGHSAPLADLSGNNRTGVLARGDTFPNTPFTSDLGCVRDFSFGNSNRVSDFNGTSACLTQGSRQSAIPGPNVFSLEAWFNTTKRSNGRIIGFGSAYEGNYSSGNSDRHIYIDKDGRIVFGTWPGDFRLTTSPQGKNYADGKWHHVVGTISGEGMKLYVDGELVSSNPQGTAAESYRGYWKVGCGRLQFWRHADGSSYHGPSYFTGKLQFVSVYEVALTQNQVREHYLAGAQ